KEYPLLKIKMPKKKPKGKELTLQERMENRKISSVRIKVEHAISGIKRFGIIWGVLRNRKEGFGDKVM
ncbi:IS5/IS1182 family transposase, partial [bacterium]|nr:IS5/IS1182 family transposase [bacterium]